jgi:hypothetical protein
VCLRSPCRIDELRRQIAEDSTFERQLERILIRLRDGATPERCGPDCGCDTDPLETGRPGGSRSMVCALGDRDAEHRIEEWHHVLAMATRSEHFDGGLRVVFDPSAEVITEVARLCAAETACCPFFSFNLAVTAAATVLNIKGPADADDLISRFFEFSVAARPMSSAEAPSLDRGLPSLRPRRAVGSIPVFAPAASNPQRSKRAGAERATVR